MRYIFTPGQTILAKNCRKTMENGKFYGRPFTDLVDKRQDGQHWETNFYPRLLIKQNILPQGKNFYGHNIGDTF